MNYLWEIMLKAKEQEIKKEKIRFRSAKRYSPYMELSEESLNVTVLEEPYEMEINPYYRFHHIFQYMFQPDFDEYPFLRKGLFQLLIHQLSENDLKAGMTREEYYKKLLKRAMENYVYGEEAARTFSFFEGEEKEVIIEGMLTLYRVGENLTLFRHVMCALFSNCIVYHSNKKPYEILVYIGKKKSESLVRKAVFIVNQFVGVRYHTELYFEYHFGIIGIEETMKTGEIAIC